MCIGKGSKNESSDSLWSCWSRYKGSAPVVRESHDVCNDLQRQLFWQSFESRLDRFILDHFSEVAFDGSVEYLAHFGCDVREERDEEKKFSLVDRDGA